MKENGKIMKEMEKEYFIIIMVKYMKENEKII